MNQDTRHPTEQGVMQGPYLPLEDLVVTSIPEVVIQGMHQQIQHRDAARRAYYGGHIYGTERDMLDESTTEAIRSIANSNQHDL